MPTYRPDLFFVSLSQLRVLTGRDARTIRKALAGVSPTKRDKRTCWYSTPVALEAIFCGAMPLEPARARARFDEARANLAELELQRRRGQLLDADDVTRVWSRRILSWRERVRGIPAEAVVHLPGFTPAMARGLSRLIHQTLVELADAPTAKREVPDDAT